MAPSKQDFFTNIEAIPGWGTNLHKMYDFLVENFFVENRCYQITEVGVFCGQSGLYLCRALQRSRIEFELSAVDMWDSDTWHQWVERVENEIFYCSWTQSLEQWREPGEFLAYFQIIKMKHLVERYGHQSYTDMVKDIFDINGFGERLKFSNIGSFGASLTVKNESLDMVMIDGEHTKKAVMRDLGYWARKVKHGGIVCGDDFNMKGVREAVTEHFQLSPRPITEFNMGIKDKFIWEQKGYGGEYSDLSRPSTFIVFKEEAHE